MADFVQAYQYLVPDEGGYVNNPADPGGETYRGISRKNWPAWGGWALVDTLRLAGVNFPRVLDINPELQSACQVFYQKNFWRFDGIENQELANKIFDECVNMGTGVVVKLLQQSLRYVSGQPIAADGQYGPQTEALINASDPAALLAELRAQIAVYYCRIGKPDFLLGWMRRMAR